MSNKAICLELIDSFEEDQLSHVITMLQGLKRMVDEASDEAYCLQLFKEYKNNSKKRKTEPISTESSNIYIADQAQAFIENQQEDKRSILNGTFEKLPFADGIKSLPGYDVYRLHVDRYHIVFTVQDAPFRVTIVGIGIRGEAKM